MIHRRKTVLAGMLCLFCFVAFVNAEKPAAAAAEQKKEGEKFLRFVDDDNGGGKLECAIVSYKNKAGQKVHLVGAVHVGEKSYYAGLEKTFVGYDALLYEMVKPKGAVIPPKNAPRDKQRQDSMVSTFQRLLKDSLELEFQLDAIDYSAKNFVHADLDAETFQQLMADRGESLITYMMRAMMSEMANPSKAQEISPFELLAAFFSPDSSRHLKLLLARQFEDIEAKMAGIEGPNGSVILTERNKAAMAVLETTLKDGKKNIGIFYGAAHLADMDKRVREMGFEKTGSEWRTAWDMTPKPGGLIVKPVKPKPAEKEAAPEK